PPGIAVEAPVGSPARIPRPFIALNISARPMSPDDDSPSVSSVTGRTTGADTVGAVERPIIVPTNSAAATEAAATTRRPLRLVTPGLRTCSDWTDIALSFLPRITTLTLRVGRQGVGGPGHGPSVLGITS